MYFESLHAALTMDGHGVYVWSAYGISLLVLGALVLLPLQGKRRFIREMRAEKRRDLSRQQSETAGPVAFPRVQLDKEQTS